MMLHARLLACVLVFVCLLLACAPGGALAYFSIDDAVYQAAARHTAEQADRSTKDWFRFYGAPPMPFAWENANGDFNGMTYDRINTVLSAPRKFGSRAMEGRGLFTNFWLDLYSNVVYSLSRKDQAAANAATARMVVLQGEVVHLYEQTFGKLTNATLSDAMDELEALRFSIGYNKVKIIKIDFVGTFALEYQWRCHQQHRQAPPHWMKTEKVLLRLLRTVGERTDDIPVSDVSILAVPRVKPSQALRDAFFAEFPCAPKEKLDEDDGFLAALFTQVLLSDSGIRFVSFPLTQNAFKREGLLRLQGLANYDGELTPQQRSGATGLPRPAFEVGRSVKDIYDDMTSPAGLAANVIRLRTDYISIGATTVASVRATLHGGDAASVDLLAELGGAAAPDGAGWLLGPAAAAAARGSQNVTDADGDDYYTECSSITIIRGLSLMPVAPAVMQLTYKNDTFDFTKSGWFNAAPLKQALKLAMEPDEGEVFNFKESGFHFGMSHTPADSERDYGGKGLASAYLLTRDRSVNIQCRYGGALTPAQAAALKRTMVAAEASGFKRWFGESGGTNAQIEAVDWDDGKSPLVVTSLDIKARLAASAGADGEAAKQAFAPASPGGVKVNFTPSLEVISTSLYEATADVLAVQVVFPADDAAAFLPGGTSFLDGAHARGPREKKTPTDAPPAAPAAGYSIGTVAVVGVAALVVGLLAGAALCRRKRDDRSASLLMQYR
jgi:hypothetical protein